MKTRFVVLLAGMNLLWAASYAIFKVLCAQMAPGAVATLRFGLTAAMLGAAWPWLRGSGPKISDLPRLTTMGVIVFCLAPRLQIEAVHRGQAGDTSLLLALDPLIVAIAAALFLGERIPARRWWGCGMGMLGVILISKVWYHEAEPMRGLLPNLLLIASFVCEAGYSVGGKPLLHRCSPVKLLGTAVIAGTMANLLVDVTLDHGATFVAIRSISASAWLFLIYLATICTIVGYTLWYVVIRETEVNVTGLTVLVQPLAGWLISVIWLGERIHWGQLWGSAAIVAGLAVGLHSNRSLRPIPTMATPVLPPSLAAESQRSLQE